ncbi:MAG TPA: SPOR domain-containing protein [Blastocatellia bacterium]|nr:SPOR domain-containing protein [Blastocatellia bacterium]
MGFEPAPLSCPLCKRRLPESVGQAPGTRLCEQCQSMVLTAFRGSIRTLDTRLVVANSQATAPAPSEPVLEDYPVMGEGEFVDDVSPDLSLSVVNETVPQFSTFETAEDSSFRFFEEQEPQYREHREETDSTDDQYEAPLYSAESLPQFYEADSRPEAESLHEISKAAEVTTTVEPDGILESATYSTVSRLDKRLDNQRDQELDQELVTRVTVPKRDNQRDQELDQELVTRAVTADPWEEPLPAWDYSQNEWPVLVGPHTRTIRRPQAAIAAASVILLVLALFYLMVYRQANAERRATDNVSQAGAAEHSASSAAAEEQKEVTQVSSDNNSLSNTEARETKSSQSDYENKNDQGKFSLQAAAFLTEADANEFAEKLKTAGVPSYVVSADVARKGRWFRVRVGRFNSADEAQRFAGEAQHRARTTGLALQLIVCQYEQP